MDRCNNVATLQGIKVEADALKIRCLNDIEAEEAKLTVVTPPVIENGGDSDIPVTPPAVKPAKKRKSISIKSVSTSSTWQIETADDVKMYVAELEKRLLDALEEDTIINIEF